MLHLIKKVEYIDGYRLKLTFNDKKQKIVDLKKYSNESPETVFFPFRDLDFFKLVKLDKNLGTIVWPNGVDLCPDALYEMGKDTEKTKPALKQRRRCVSSVSTRTKGNVAAKSKN